MENVKAKLCKARKMFLDEHVQKSGKNMHLEFKYFELSDIVPSATTIFDKLGLLHIVNFDKKNEVATMTFISTDDSSDEIVFSIPYVEDMPKANKQGQIVSNPLQLAGSSYTYMRRYLYLIALDIVEQDEIEPNLKNEGEEKKTPVQKKTAPASKEQRSENKKTLTQKENASAEELKQLKAIAKKLLATGEEGANMANTVALKSNGFKELPKDVCLDLIKKMTKIVEKKEKSNG